MGIHELIRTIRLIVMYAIRFFAQREKDNEKIK